jgi:hypothetical protein
MRPGSSVAGTAPASGNPLPGTGVDQLLATPPPKK